VTELLLIYIVQCDMLALLGLGELQYGSRGC
jgi:hypothetical protein